MATQDQAEAESMKLSILRFVCRRCGRWFEIRGKGVHHRGRSKVRACCVKSVDVLSREIERRNLVWVRRYLESLRHFAGRVVGGSRVLRSIGRKRKRLIFEGSFTPWRRSSGTFVHAERRLVLRAGTDQADACAVILHELAHAACEPDRDAHGARWRRVFVKVATEVLELPASVHVRRPRHNRDLTDEIARLLRSRMRHGCERKAA